MRKKLREVKKGEESREGKGCNRCREDGKVERRRVGKIGKFKGDGEKRN